MGCWKSKSDNISKYTLDDDAAELIVRYYTSDEIKEHARNVEKRYRDNRDWENALSGHCFF